MVCVLLLAGGCSRKHWDVSRNVDIINSSGERIGSIDTGQTVHVGLRSLEPDRTYRAKLTDESGKLVSYYQLTSDAHGVIEPSPVWYNSGVVGCGRRIGNVSGPYRFQTFEEAQKALANRNFTLTIEDRQGKVIGKRRLPIAPANGPAQPLVYFSDDKACLMNSYVVGEEDVHLTAKNLPRGAAVQIFLVPHRYGWRAGMTLNEVRPEYQRHPQALHLKDRQTSFSELLWKASETRRGAYDAVLRINNADETSILLEKDLVLYFHDTGTIIHFVFDPPWAPNDFDIAGRPVKNFGYPYFEFHDVFAVGEPMWGAVDPAMVPANHPGGAYAAYYVIQHGSALNGLVDVTEGLEIMPVKGWCINMSQTRIWNNPQPGIYDIVVDFGANPAASAAGWVADNTFNVGVDFIDRATAIGAYVVNDPADPGPFNVLSWEYKPDPNNPNDPLWTDVSSYFNSPSPLVTTAPPNGLGIQMNHVPLHGIVRYPFGNGPFPLVLIVHGNHDPLAANETGYNYLLDLLASHGFIAVSVDENFLNYAWGEMDARAIVLLRHLQRWRTWNGTANHPFFNKVDLSHIGLAGHSRGGEAITVAWLFNTMLHNPNDPDHNFNFTLPALYAIAPVDGQIVGDINPHTGQPYTGVPVVIQNSDYMVMHGTHDGDVYDFEGYRTFDRAHPVGSNATATKSLLWVHGAIHNLWNDVWGNSDPCVVQSPLPFISKADEQSIGKAFVSAFYQMSLQGKKEYAPMLAGDVKFASMPANITLVDQYQPKDRLFLDHYEEDNNLQTGSFPGVTNDNLNNVLNPYQQYAFSDEGNPYWLWEQTNGLVAGWPNITAQYVINVPQAVANQVDTYPYLSFRVGQIYEPVPSKNSPGNDQDFTVVLDLGNVTSHALRVSNFAGLPYPVQVTRPMGCWHSGDVTKTVLRTVRIPLRSFVVNRADWDLHNLSRIRFTFDQRNTGLVAIDDIQLTK